jgi:hypothetical protein
METVLQSRRSVEITIESCDCIMLVFKGLGLLPSEYSFVYYTLSEQDVFCLEAKK